MRDARCQRQVFFAYFLLTPGQKVRRMAGRDPPVLIMFEFVISKVERDLLLNQISPFGRNDKNNVVGYRPDSRVHFLWQSRKENEPKETAHLQWA